MPKRKSDGCPKPAQFTWDEQRSNAAIGLATGRTQEEVSKEVGCSRRTLVNWLQNEDFSAEVDRLSLMVDVASRAHRLRLANRVIREKTKGNIVETDRDLLDWLKFAQSETDGVKLDLSKLAALTQTAAPVADSGSNRDSETKERVRQHTPAEPLSE